MPNYKKASGCQSAKICGKNSGEYPTTKETRSKKMHPENSSCHMPSGQYGVHYKRSQNAQGVLRRLKTFVFTALFTVKQPLRFFMNNKYPRIFDVIFLAESWLESTLLPRRNG